MTETEEIEVEKEIQRVLKMPARFDTSWVAEEACPSVQAINLEHHQKMLDRIQATRERLRLAKR